jgi:hypothetical protein
MCNNPLLGQRRTQLDGLIGFGLAGAALGLYLLTLAPTVLEADGGEFQFVPWLPGIAHPTGYPLYTLLGWLWSHLFAVGEVAWRMNLFSALLAAAAIGLLFWIERELLSRVLPETTPPARQAAAAVAAAAFAVTPAFWSQAIIAEVYALHTLLVALVLWLALAGRTRWLALALGLGLTHHVTIILLLPALLLYYATFRRGSAKASTPEAGLAKASTPAAGPANASTPVAGFSARSAGLHLALFLLPLLLYLYLPLIAPHTPYAQLVLSANQTLTLYENTLPGFWRHVTAAVFSGELRPAAVGWDRLVLAWDLLLRQVGWLGLLLSLAGLASLWWQRQTGLLLLTGLTFLAIAGFNLIYFIGDVFVLFIPAWLIVCMWLGLGLLTLTDGLARRFIRSKISPTEDAMVERMQTRLGQQLYRMISTGLALFFFVLPAWLLINHFNQIDQSQNIAARSRWQEILAEPLPEAAILISNDRNEIMPMWYYQYVEQRRPDLAGLFPKITPDPAYASLGGLLEQALASGRPVYLIKPMAGLELKADLEPAGGLVRVRPSPAEPFYQRNLLLPEIRLPNGLTETIRLLGYDLEPAAAVEPGTEITVTLYWRPVQPLSQNYSSYVHLVNSAGQGVSQSDGQPGGVFYPSQDWQVGEHLRDRRRLAVPADAPPGLYRLRAGLYYQPEPGLILGMGGGLELGPLVVTEGQAAPAPPPAQPVELKFGQTILLRGYDLLPLAEDQLLLNLVWQAGERQPVDWTVFIHLLDSQGRLIAQADGQPRSGTYQTPAWTAGELVQDPHLLNHQAGEGDYQVAFGLYNPQTGERLLITNSRGEVIGDRMTIPVSL